MDSRDYWSKDFLSVVQREMRPDEKDKERIERAVGFFNSASNLIWSGAVLFIAGGITLFHIGSGGIVAFFRDSVGAIERLVGYSPFLHSTSNALIIGLGIAAFPAFIGGGMLLSRGIMLEQKNIAHFIERLTQ